MTDIATIGPDTIGPDTIGPDTIGTDTKEQDTCEPGTSPAARAERGGTFRSLRQRNFRLFFGGQLISQIAPRSAGRSSAGCASSTGRAGV